MARVLILPGDVRWNLGDTAILLGVRQMVREIDPSCELAVWGRPPDVSGGLEDVTFHPKPTPGLWRAAARADVALWGGGQLLQGNRSRVKVPYWAARVGLVRLLGTPIVAVGQGVGPLPARLDRRLAAALAKRTVRFGVRDADSLRLLEDAGVPGDRLLLGADPALLWAAGDPATEPARPAPARPALGLSLRWTAHHRPGRLVPFQRLPAAARRRALDTPAYRRFTADMIRLADRLIDELDVDLRLFPMYLAPWETDVRLAEAIASGVRRLDRVRVVLPERSLAEVVTALRELDAFVGVPMHSTILATAQGVPTLAVPYEPKGTEYLRSLGRPDLALPLEEILREGGDEVLFRRIRELWEDRHRIRADLAGAVPKLRDRARRGAEPLRLLLDPERSGPPATPIPLASSPEKRTMKPPKNTGSPK